MARTKDTKKENVITKENKEIKKENIEVMSLDNKPINKDVTKEKIVIPNKFVDVKPQKVEVKKEIKINNGRVYKDLGNGYGMYADNGEVFKK